MVRWRIPPSAESFHGFLRPVEEEIPGARDPYREIELAAYLRLAVGELNLYPCSSLACRGSCQSHPSWPASMKNALDADSG